MKPEPPFSKRAAPLEEAPSPASKKAPVLGLIGGIGCGKSTVAAAFATLGCPVLDADRSAHLVLNSAALRPALLARFGPGVEDREGSVDRQHIARRVFGSATRPLADRRWLEARVHPETRALLARQLETARAQRPPPPAILLDVPLLIEGPLAAWCDSIIFVACSHAIRLARVQEHRGWSAEELDRREGNQAPLAAKRAAASHTVTNESTPAALQAEAERVLRAVRSASGKAKPR